MKKYFKNFILCGEINYHCLLCVESFTDMDLLEKHIRWEKHRKAIKGQSYIPKFKKDNIYKVGSIFYCELCNYSTESADEILGHTKEENHKLFKADPEKIPTKDIIPKLEEDNIVIHGDITVTNEEWHGIFKKHCLFCDVNVKNINEHVATTIHMMKLISAQTLLEKGVFYRKLNAITVYCYECKKTFTQEEFTNHLANKHSEIAKYEKQDEKIKQYFNVDLDNDTATCKLCNLTMKYKFITLERHMQIHLGTDENPGVIADEDLKLFMGIVDHGKRRAMLKEYGKDHFIKLNRGGSKGYCSLCNMFLSAHMSNFKQHVKGLNHKGHLELKALTKRMGKPEKMRYKTKPLKRVVRELYYIRDSASVLINSDLTVQMLSFLFLAPLFEVDKFKCFICDELIDMSNTDHYKKGSVHSEKFVGAEVVVSLKGEFVREIQPGLYHCAFCNQVYPNWELLEKHMQGWKHRFAKVNSIEIYQKAMEMRVNATHDLYRELLVSLDFFNLE